MLALAGCAIGPNYQRPKVDAPAFKETGDWKPATPGEQIPRGQWWQTYGDPVLNGLEDRIEVSSNTLQAAEAQYRQAQAAATIASSALFPSISADGSASRAKSPARGGSPATIGNNFGAGLTAGGEFDLWGRVRRSAEAGRAAAEASSAGYQAQSYSHLFSVPNEIWSVGAGAIMPLFEAGKVRAQVRQARAFYDESLANYRQTVLTAFQEVEDNLAAAAILTREAAVQAEALAAARQSATITLNQYQAGTVSYLNVVTAQAAQLDAERTAVQLLGRQLNASVTLLKAAGGDWRTPGDASR